MGKPITRPGSSANTDRNFEKKVQFYAKVRDVVFSLNAKKTISKTMCVVDLLNHLLRSCTPKTFPIHGRVYAEALLEMKIQQQRTPAVELKVNCKSRGKLILREGKQFGTVLNHPAFHSNPLAAIHQHLESTQAVANEKPKKKLTKIGSKKTKEKAAEGPRSMEM